MYSCDFIIKGKIIDKKVVAYTGWDSTCNIVAIKAAILDKYGYSIEDTIWIYPDFELYFNGQKRFDKVDRDSVYLINGKDIDYETCFHINFDINGLFKTDKLCFIRFRKEDSAYIYSLSDVYLPVYIEDNNVYVNVNRFQKYTNIFRPLDNYDKYSLKRFERRIRKWSKKKQ